MVTDMGHPGYSGRLSENAVTLAEVVKSAGYRTFMSGKWHVGTERPDATWIRAILRHADQRADVLGSRAIPAPAPGKQDAKLRPGCFLRHRCADRSRRRFSRGRPHDPGSAVVPLSGVSLAAFSAARASRGHRQVPRQIHGGMGLGQTGAPGPDEAAAAGGARYPIVAALEVHQPRRDRQRGQPAVEQPAGRPPRGSGDADGDLRGDGRSHGPEHRARDGGSARQG